MIWLKLIPWGLAAVGVVAAAVLGWLLLDAHERIGTLKEAYVLAAKANLAKTEATKSRAQTQQRVRQMAPAEKLKGLE